MNILYLENHDVFARQVTKTFSSAHEVTLVPTLSAARIVIASQKFDIILSDYDLDDGKGDEFVREFHLANPTVPIIAASSHDVGNAALIAAGASAICGKMEFDKIQQTIAKPYR